MTFKQNCPNNSKNSSSDNKISEQECKHMRLQRQKGIKYWNISENFDLKISEIAKHIQGDCTCDINVEPITSDKPWKEKETMRKLYEDENMYFTEIAEIVGCHPETSREWIVEKHDISKIENSNRTSSKKVRELQRLGASIFNDEEEKHPVDKLDEIF